MTKYTVVKTFKTFKHSLYHRNPEQVLDIICDDLGDQGDHELTDLNQAIERYQNHQFRDFTAQVIPE